MIRLFFCGMLFSFLFSCSSKEYSFQYVDERSEDFGNALATMEVYGLNDSLNLQEVKEFCKEKRDKSYAQNLLFVVFFDSAKNASLPKNPISAFYGIDEIPLSHIKAYMEFNKPSNQCKLYVFEKNAFESPATIYPL